jgi:hypothetical protein
MSSVFTPEELNRVVCKTVKERLEDYVKTLPKIILDNEEWFYQTSYRYHCKFHIWTCDTQTSLSDQLEDVIVGLKIQIDALIQQGTTNIGSISVKFHDICPKGMYYRYQVEICRI